MPVPTISMPRLATVRIAGAGASALCASALGLEYLWPKISKATHPSFTYLPTTTGEGGLVMVLCHGMQAAAEQWDPLLAGDGNDLRTIGNVLLAVNGCNPLIMPGAIRDALTARGLMGHEIMLVGLSLGTNTVVATQRGPMVRRFLAGHHLTDNLRPLARSAVLISGPAAPEFAIWPSPLLEHGTRVLGGGWMSRLLWHEINLLALKRAFSRFEAAQSDNERQDALASILDVARCLNISPTRMINDTHRLHRGPRLRDKEFPHTETLVIERTGDDRVLPCYEQWQLAFPLSEYYLIEDPPGHATLDDCPEQYTDTILQWRQRVRARDSRTALRAVQAALRANRRAGGPWAGTCATGARRFRPSGCQRQVLRYATLSSNDTV
jgi:hypothetical protein